MLLKKFVTVFVLVFVGLVQVSFAKDELKREMDCVRTAVRVNRLMNVTFPTAMVEKYGYAFDGKHLIVNPEKRFGLLVFHDDGAMSTVIKDHIIANDEAHVGVTNSRNSRLKVSKSTRMFASPASLQITFDATALNGVDLVTRSYSVPLEDNLTEDTKLDLWKVLVKEIHLIANTAKKTKSTLNAPKLKDELVELKNSCGKVTSKDNMVRASVTLSGLSHLIDLETKYSSAEGAQKSGGKKIN